MKKIFYIALILLSFVKTSAQDTPYVGQIKMFAGNFPPAGWAFCDGQLMSIAENEVLFAIIGTTYGGDGQTTFALPDLRGRIPMGTGQGPGLSSRILGQKLGTEQETMTINQMPSHSHIVNATTAEGNQNVPTGNLFANTKVLDKEYSDAPGNTTMKNTMIGNAGGNQPMGNMQPYLGVNFIISLYGIFPSQSKN